jgi:hypothetical protein
MLLVMRGLDRIHRASKIFQRMDCRVNPGNDEPEGRNNP